MRIIDRFVLRSSIGLILLGVAIFFCPGVEHATNGWDLIARLSFVLLLGFILLVWAHGMQTTAKRIPMVLLLLVPLLALFNVADTTSREVPLPVAMQLSGSVLVLCGFGLMFLFGISFKRAAT
jgi:hypothetical protein